MRRLVYLTVAKRDLAQILRYVARESGSVETARRFTAALREQCVKLASLPGDLGVARPELRPDVRSFAHKGYVIFFRYRESLFEKFVWHFIDLRSTAGDKAGADRKPTGGELGSGTCFVVDRPTMRQHRRPINSSHLLTAKLMKCHTNFSNRL